LLCPLAAKKPKPRPLLLLPRHLPLRLLLPLRPLLLLKPPSLLKPLRLLHLLLPLRPLLLLKLPSLLKPLLLLRPLTRSNLCFLEKRGFAPFFFALNFGELKKAPAGAFL
jgi:hypothetical protein